MMKREYQKPLIGWKTMYEDEEEFTGGGDAKPAHFSVWEE